MYNKPRTQSHKLLITKTMPKTILKHKIIIRLDFFTNHKREHSQIAIKKGAGKTK
ncbi:MAG: hypothetical protein N4A49_16355 [Marinifilaceae bacterium]|jgi:hypothetical protein|nr:hypothetical protein [Marinifilaceae bacterium]